MTSNVTRCRECGRVLRSAKSIADGMGRTCARKVARRDAEKAIVDTFPVAQVEKAREVIELGAYSDRGTFFSIVSSDGSQLYGATTEDCTCKAAMYGRTCYHRLAVMLLTA